ncbi:MAG: OmpA family protein [Flavobacteriales bacterium]|nr:OmpA family protein [Flavobacteriales bacterium]
MKYSSHLYKALGLALMALAISVASIAQPTNDNRADATEIEDLLHWCSPLAGMSNKGATEDGDKIGCMSNEGPNFNVWYKFRASTENVQVVVSTGDLFGTMKFANVALFDEFGKELACDEYSDEYGDVGLTSTEMSLGNWYYIQVDHANNSSYPGTFTLCVTDELGYDFQDGAKEIMNLSQWCSKDGEFSTKKGSPDGGTGECLPSGPNFNKWFKFYARSEEIEVKVTTGDDKGTCQFPVVMLWDASFNRIACGKWQPESADECSLKGMGLKKKNWYYISVDHVLNANYPGTFTLCVNKGGTAETVGIKEKIAIRGRLVYNLYEPVLSKINLLDENDKVLATTNTDKTGKFRFDDLPSEVDYTVVVENYQPDQEVAIVQTNYTGRIIKKAFREEKNVFRFNLLPPDCYRLGLLSCENPGLIPDAGKVGVLGVIATKDDPLGGLENVNVGLYKDTETLIGETQTDQQGRFKFNNLPFESGYLVKVDDNADNLYVEMLMVNDEGDAIMAATLDNLGENGFFNFTELPYMKVYLDELKLDDLSDLELIDMSVGTAIQLNNVYFNQGKFDLQAESNAELDKLVVLLNENKEVKIEVAGHTDNMGTLQFNLKLSANRAKAVMDYLVEKGISPSRLTYRGYGSMKPLSKNQSEAELKKDRRVEFIILG